MKFGRRLQEEAFQEFQPHYIAYKELKKAIKLITGSDTSQYTISEVTSNFGNIPALAGSTYRPAESRFQDLLNFEVEKINQFSALVYSSISSSLQAALKTLYHGEVQSLELLNALRESSETSADGVSYLHAYSRLNFIGFRKITKKYDKHNKSAASGFYLARLVKEPFVNMNFDFLLELISIVFGEMRRVRCQLLRKDNHMDGAESCNSVESDEDGDDNLAYEEDDIDLDDDVTLPSSIRTMDENSSEMTNTTYFIGESDLMRVRVHLAKHIPLVSLGSILCPKPSRSVVKAFVTGIPHHHQEGSTCVRIEGPGSKPLPKCARINTTLMLDASGNFVNPAIYRYEQNRVSAGCAYFDNDGLEIYRELLSPQIDESKAEILRLRWVPNQGPPSQNQTVTLEIVKAFQPANSANEWHDIKVDNTEGSVPNAVILRRNQIPDILSGTLQVESILSDLHLSPTREAQVKSVLQRALSLIHDRQCHPRFQEWFYRSHFRKSGLNCCRHVFANLDERIRFTHTERDLQRDPLFHRFWIAPHLAPFIIDKDVYSCPYGVLTISLAGSYKPKFLPKITGLTTVSEVWRYAPHLHGVPLFKRFEFGSSNLPHWFQFVTTDTEEAKPTPTSKSAKETKREDSTSTEGGGPLRVDVVSNKQGAKLLHEHAATMQQQQDVSAGEERRHSTSVSCQPSLSTSKTPGVHYGLNEPLLGSVNVPISEPLGQPYHAIALSRAGSNARTPLLIGTQQAPDQGESYLSRVAQSVSEILLNRPRWIFTSTAPQSAIVGTAVVRVEPKTFFANERTLLQWMNTAVLLSTISITLLNFGTQTGRTAGLIMAPVALFFIIYSFLVYLRRSYSLEKKEPINYNDRFGPAILVLCLICALSAIIILNIVYGPDNEISMPTRTDSPVADASKSVTGSGYAPMPHPTMADFLPQTYDVVSINKTGQ